MAVRQKHYDRQRRNRDRRELRDRDYLHAIWRVLVMPYTLVCPKGHRLGYRGQVPFEGTIECRKCHQTFTSTNNVRHKGEGNAPDLAV